MYGKYICQLYNYFKGDNIVKHLERLDVSGISFIKLFEISLECNVFNFVMRVQNCNMNIIFNKILNSSK